MPIMVDIMYNDFIEILKSWNGFAQFIFLFLIMFTLLGAGLLIIKMIAEFLTETLPILVRGYPPIFYTKEKQSDEEEKDNDD